MPARLPPAPVPHAPLQQASSGGPARGGCGRVSAPRARPYLGDGARYDALPLVRPAALHGVGLARPRLPVAEQADLESVQRALHQVADLLKHGGLGGRVGGGGATGAGTAQLKGWCHGGRSLHLSLSQRPSRQLHRPPGRHCLACGISPLPPPSTPLGTRPAHLRGLRPEHPVVAKGMLLAVGPRQPHAEAVGQALHRRPRVGAYAAEHADLRAGGGTGMRCGQAWSSACLDRTVQAWSHPSQQEEETARQPAPTHPTHPTTPQPSLQLATPPKKGPSSRCP